MRTIPAPLQTTLETAAYSLATLVKLIKSDGQIIGLTTWDESITADIDGDGDVVYNPQDIESVSTFSASINAAIDDAELIVPIDDIFIADDIRRFFWAGATAKVGYVDPNDLANAWLHRYYEVGQIEVEGVHIKIELLGPEKRLEGPVGVPITLNCRFSFGDMATCGINIDVEEWAPNASYNIGDEIRPTGFASHVWFFAAEAGTGGVGTSGPTEPNWNLATSGTIIDNNLVWHSMGARKVFGTVTAVTDARNFAASGIDVEENYFAEGIIEWLYGRNSGELQRVKTDNGLGSIIQHRPCLDVPQVGDTFYIIVGCRKRLFEDCVRKHDNAARSFSRTLRHGAFPYLAPEQSGVSAPKKNNKKNKAGPR